MRVAEVMTGPLVTIQHDTTVAAAWAIMRERGVRHLPVLDGHRRLLGMLTDHDLRHVVLERCQQEGRGGARGGRASGARRLGGSGHGHLPCRRG